MDSRLDPSQMSQGHANSDRSVAAHAQVSDIVEENDAGRASGILRLQQQSTHHDIRAARFVYNGRAKRVVLFTKGFELFGRAAAL